MQTARYPAVLPKIDRRRPIEGEIDHQRSIEGKKGKKKKKRKEEKRRRGEEISTSFPRAVLTRTPSRPSLASTFSPTRGDGTSPHAGRKIEATRGVQYKEEKEKKKRMRKRCIRHKGGSEQLL
ncbi:hypothetical protein BHM03_00012503 [Ensete ventricosum]|nr:hypothetical protein BHM03_00012503 [Ensete ventricosum]